MWFLEGRRENRLRAAVKRPSCWTQKGAPYGVGVHVDETGTAEEECFLPGVGVYVDALQGASSCNDAVC